MRAEADLERGGFVKAKPRRGGINPGEGEAQESNGMVVPMETSVVVNGLSHGIKP
jgi:hypothetical protein